MFAIGFEKWDLLLIRFSKTTSNKKVGYIRYCLRDELEPTKLTTRKEAEDVLKEILSRNINFVNDSIPNSIVNRTNIDKSKLQIFEIEDI